MSPSLRTGTSGPPGAHLRLPAPDPRTALRFAAGFACTLALWFFLRADYARLVVACAARILSALSGMPPGELVIETPHGFVLNTGLVVGGRPVTERLPLDPATWNIAFLGALVLATPLSRLRRRAGRALLAVVLLYATQVLYLAAAVHGQVAALYERHGIPFQPHWVTRALAFAVQGYSVTLSLAMPFLVFVPLVWLGAERPSRLGGRGRAPGRNAPCPCGSGLKFKRCCGRPTST